MTRIAAWKNPQEAMFASTKTPLPKSKVPGPETLPVGRWVVLSKESTKKWGRVMLWLKEKKYKYQLCRIMINQKETQVFLFKKSNHAVMFKLTWG